MATMADTLIEELMDLCDCQSGLRAIYYCKKTKCSSNTIQPVYCHLCYEKEIHPDQKLVRVVTEVNEWQIKWNKVKGEISSLKDAAS